MGGDGGGGQRGGGDLGEVSGRRAYGCHFDEIPCMRSQALLAMCMLAGIQFPGNNNLGRGEKG